MSSEATKWAKRQVIEDRTLSDLLSALARSAEDGGRCKVTQAKLATNIGVTDRTVRNLLPILESFGLITRARQQVVQKRGRAADLLILTIGRDFTLTKEKIMGAKRVGPTGKDFRLNDRDQPEKISTGPKAENDASLYIARTRGVLVDGSPSESSRNVSVSTHVRFDRGRSKWRASITADGVTMDLGRFDSEAEATAFAAQAEQDVRRTSSMKAGSPSFPVVSPSKAKLDAPFLGAWLFGGDHAEPCDDGEREAVAVGQGTKFLAGVWGEQPHEESSEQDAARARAGANDDHNHGRVA